MPLAEYRFVRNRNVSGFLSENRPSTDALNALERWHTGNNGRSYDIKHDEDEFLIAQLFWQEGDADACSDLDTACCQSGVVRKMK